MNSELPPYHNPENTPVHEPDDEMFNDPNFQASLAFFQLDSLLEQWMHSNPDVTEDDVDAALARFREKIKERDSRERPGTE